jgi:hypothetical protein
MEQLIRFLRAIWLSIIAAFVMCKSLWNRNTPSLDAPLPEPTKNTQDTKTTKKEAKLKRRLTASSHRTIVTTMEIFQPRERTITPPATREPEKIVTPGETVDEEINATASASLDVLLSLPRGVTLLEETPVIQKTLDVYIRENCPGHRPLKLPLPIMTLLTQFNIYASPAENYRHALFLFGSGTLYDTPTVWTFMCNATLNEIETLLLALNYDPELINLHAPNFQFSKSGYHFCITPLPGLLEEDVCCVCTVYKKSCITIKLLSFVRCWVTHFIGLIP